MLHLKPASVKHIEELDQIVYINIIILYSALHGES